MPISSSFQQTTQPPWLSDILRSIAERSEAVRKKEYRPYAGERIEPLNEDIEAAFALGRHTGDWKPYMKLSQEYLKTGGEEYPENVERYMNPYQQYVIDALRKQAAESFSEETLPALSAHYAGLGHWGSGEHIRARERAQKIHEQQLQRQIAQALAHGYETGGRQFEAAKARQAGLAESAHQAGTATQAQKLADISTLGQIGEYKRGLGQAKKDVAYQDFLKQEAYPQEALKEQAGVLAGYPTMGVIYQQQQTPGSPQVNTLGNLGALAGSLYGINKAYGERKKGGSIKKPKGIAGHSFMQSSLYKKPKVGQVHTLYKGGR